MSIFRLEPHGYYRHEQNFKFWVNYENNEVTVSENKIGTAQILCKVLQDDYGNGGAEFIINNYIVNEWSCEYAKTSWRWNESLGFIMINRAFQPVSIKQLFGFGIAQKPCKDLCMNHIKLLLKTASSAMKQATTIQQLAKIAYKIQ